MTDAQIVRELLVERTWMLVGEWGIGWCTKCAMCFSYKREHRARIPIVCKECQP